MEVKEERVSRKEGHGMLKRGPGRGGEEDLAIRSFLNLRGNRYIECQEKKPQRNRLRGEYVAQK